MTDHQCRPVEVDGETIRVHGGEPLTPAGREALTEIVRAAKRQLARDGTPLVVLRDHGLTRHQTAPLLQAGHDIAEAVAELVDAHRDHPDGSVLSTIPGMGARRVTLVCDAIDRWRGETR